MRILLVANTLPPADLSGVGEQVLQLASGLRDEGHDVQILGRGTNGIGASKLLFPLTVLPRFWQALRRFRPHVVQVHESDGALAALLVATMRALLNPVPQLVALLQVSYVEEMRAVRPLRDGDRVIGVPGAQERVFRYFKAPIQVTLGCLSAWLSDVTLAPSRVTAEEIKRDYQVRTVGVLPNVMGGRTTESGNDVDSRTAPTTYLLFVGRLRIRKGLEVLLEALALLQESLPEARLLVAGDGEHGRYLRRKAANLGLSEAVRFLGPCNANQVKKLLSGARALVVPSIYEGMPLVVLEAMHTAIPVVATRVSGIPEVVEHGSTGWLVPSEDPHALAQALAEVWHDPEEARRRGTEAENRVARDFHPRVAAQIWQQAVLGNVSHRVSADSQGPVGPQYGPKENRS